jgi:hypothetical protein
MVPAQRRRSHRLWPCRKGEDALLASVEEWLQTTAKPKAAESAGT